MKHLKKFEFFFNQEEKDEKNTFAEELMPDNKEQEINYLEEEECVPCSEEEEEEEEKDWNDDNSDTIKVEGFKSFNEKKKLTKKQKNALEVLDKNKNGKIDAEDFEILRKSKKAAAEKDSSKEEDEKGLTPAQKKLPDALKASILKKRTKK